MQFYLEFAICGNRIRIDPKSQIRRLIYIRKTWRQPSRKHINIHLSLIHILIESDSINIQEARLFKQRVHFPDGLYMISRIQSSQLHKHKTLQDYIELESYPEIHKLKELSGAIMKKGSLGPYATKPSNKENVEIYKYAIKACLLYTSRCV